VVPVVRLAQGTLIAARAENVLCVGLIYWLLLDLLQGIYELDMMPDQARLTYLAIGLTAVGIWIGASIKPWRRPAFLERELHMRWDPDSVFQAGAVCFCLGMLAFAIPSDFDIEEMVSALPKARFSAPWIRGQLGGIDAIWDHLQYFGYVLPTLYVVYGRERGWASPKALLLLVMAVIIVAFLTQSGGRRIIGVTLGAAVMCWGLGEPRLAVKNVLGVLIGSAAILYFLELILSYRSEGWLEEVEPLVARVRVDDNFLRLAETIQLIPDQVHYVYWRQFAYLLARPIPRFLWPDKPTDPGFDLTEQVSGDGASLSMTMIGEWYTMWGFPAVLFGGWFYGRLAAFVDGMLDQRDRNANSIVIPVCIMVMFVGLRSLQDLLIMSYAVFGWLLVSALLLRARGPRLRSRLLA
jgi:hypothetical protein